MPNDFAREWIDRRLAGQVAEALAEVLGDRIEVRVVVDARAAELPQQSAAVVDTEAPTQQAPAPERPKRGGRGGRHRDARADLNQRYVFDRFVKPIRHD